MSVRRLAPWLACGAVVLAATPAVAQQLKINVEGGDQYAGIPFVLVVTADGFDEDPQPEAPALEIPGCRITFAGVSPNVSSMVQIINGRMSESRSVKFLYRYRVEAQKAGVYRVPALTVVQAGKQASTPPADLKVLDVATTRDMKIRLNLPKRPVWVGETFEVTLDWFLRKDVDNHSFVIPLFDSAAVQISPPAQVGRQRLAFAAGARQIELPYHRGTVSVGGVQYTRLRFRAVLTPNQPGTIELPPAQVAAELKVGGGGRRDFFGFRVAKRKLFKAQDIPRRLEVRPLPFDNRPASFSNAVGKAFSIQAQASRTVVRVGDPVELLITIRGRGNLEGLSLPKLDAKGGLSPDQFSVTDDAPVGELIEDGKGKQFRVTVRLKSARVRGVPPLAFSYFDPTLGQYRTVRSEPIALSVGGSALVSASDVVSSAPEAERPVAKPGQTVAPRAVAISLVGADLSLSAEARTLRQPAGTADLRLPLLAGYVLPLLLLGFRIWRVRTEGRRGKDSDVRRALDAVESELAAAADRPARDSASKVLTLLRALAKTTGQDPDDGRSVLQRLETEAFDPRAAQEPLPADLRREVRELARRWADAYKDENAPARAGAAATGLALAAALTLSATSPAEASAQPGPQDLTKARDSYGRALSEPDRTRRMHAFSEAATRYGQLVQHYPDRPELLADWGNAALGAQELGTAALAYRRALRLDPTLDRARRNLSWVRGRMPNWLAKPESKGAMDSLFFWHYSLTAPERHLIGAAAFFVAVLLCAPWSRSPRRRRILRRFAVLFAAIWIAAFASVMLSADAAPGAVVVSDGALLRSADSLGAPATLARPLPAGAEVTLLEARDVWTRVMLADGTSGWLPSSTVEAI